MISINDYLYSGDTVLKILQRYYADLKEDAKVTHNAMDVIHCNFLLQQMELLEHNMYSLSVNEEDRVVGFDGGVCDAEIESLRFLDGNVIIYAELGVYGAWGDISQEYAHPVRDDALMEYVLANHEYLRNYANQKIQWIIDCKQN